MPKKGNRRSPQGEGQITINPAVLEELIPGPMDAAAVESVFQQLKRAVLERALGAELTHHLGYAKGEVPALARIFHEPHKKG